jgi:uncharacterized protein YbaA (DUF1428 family)
MPAITLATDLDGPVTPATLDAYVATAATLAAFWAEHRALFFVGAMVHVPDGVPGIDLQQMNFGRFVEKLDTDRH